METIRYDVQSRRFAVSDNLIKMETGEDAGHKQIDAAIPESSLFSSRTLSQSKERDHTSINGANENVDGHSSPFPCMELSLPTEGDHMSTDDASRSQSSSSPSKTSSLSRGEDRTSIDDKTLEQGGAPLC